MTDASRIEMRDRIMLLDRLCDQLRSARDDDFDALLVDIRLALSASHREQLQQLIRQGPVWDGDVISKADRGDLIRWGLAARVIVKGKDGFTAATYRGAHVMSDRVEVTS